MQIHYLNSWRDLQTLLQCFTRHNYDIMTKNGYCVFNIFYLFISRGHTTELIFLKINIWPTALFQSTNTGFDDEIAKAKKSPSATEGDWD